ncbi:MAG: metal-dependent hydrolase [Saprospiraceae bacterium]
MDSITHLALGACMGEAFAGKKLGNKAMVWGAVAQSIPDIDFITSFWMGTEDNLLAHRGFTHSFLFIALISPVFALCAERWHRPHNISLVRWMVFFALVILGHVVLDAFNNYGVGWWEPFNHHRISFNAIYVADPFFSIWPAIAIAMILIKKRDILWNQRICMSGMLVSLVYLFYCSFNKFTIDRIARLNFTDQHIKAETYFTTPTPLQNWLWYIVGGNEDGFVVGFHSLFEKDDHIDFHYFPKNDIFLKRMTNQEEIIKLKRFSQGFYTVEQWSDTLVFNDLRFGQMIGWDHPDQRFVFHFFLEKKGSNDLVVQRGRFQGWNYQVLKQYIRRIFKE